MSPEQQRIAIAEACGWVWYRIPTAPPHDRIYRCLFLPALHEYEGQSERWLVKADGTERICGTEYMTREGLVPDYPNDLNAIHEALRGMLGHRAKNISSTEQRDALIQRTFEVALYAIITRDDSLAETALIEMYRCANATARQLSEAYLRTIGKWTESSTI